MRTSDLQFKAEVGQYWFNTYTLTVHKVAAVTDTLVSFEGGDSYVPPLGSAFVYLWYSKLLSLNCFPLNNPSEKPQPGQIWINHISQDLVIIHPNQTKLPKGAEKIRVLSDSSRIEGQSHPLKKRPVETDSVGKDMLRNQLMLLKEGHRNPDEVYALLISIMAPKNDLG